ncbi:MAG: ArnT family glycosyltransferase [Myxococcota bacterium]
MAGEASDRRWLLALVAALALFYVGSSFWPGVLDETSGQYAGAAREMWRTGDWLMPTNDGVPRLQKPPLYYWTLLASYAAFGVDVFAARLPGALATLAWLFAIAGIGREIGGVGVGLRAAAVLGATFGTLVFCHLIHPEPLFGFLLATTVWALVRGLRDPSRARLWMTLAWLGMGLASMTKGLHGAAYPLALAAVMAGFMPEVRPVFRRLLDWRGPLLWLLLLAPWYATIESRLPGFVRDQLLNEQLGHVFDTRTPADSSPVPLWAFLLEHGVLLLPWIGFAPTLLRSRGLRRTGDPFRQRAIRLLWIWPALTLGTVLFSARQDYYTLSSWGALAILFSLAIDDAERGRVRLSRAPGFVVAILGLAVGMAGVALWASPAGPAVGVAPAGERPHLWETLRGFSPSLWRGLWGVLLGIGASWLASGLAAGWLLARRQGGRAVCVLAAGGLAVGGMAVAGLHRVQDYLGLESIARAIERSTAPDARVVAQGPPHRAASLFFYLDRPVHWVDYEQDIDFASRVHGIGRDLFWMHSDVVQAWGEPRELVLVTEEWQLVCWRAELGQGELHTAPFARSGTRVAISNAGRPRARSGRLHRPDGSRFRVHAIDSKAVAAAGAPRDSAPGEPAPAACGRGGER